MSSFNHGINYNYDRNLITYTIGVNWFNKNYDRKGCEPVPFTKSMSFLNAHFLINRKLVSKGNFDFQIGLGCVFRYGYENVTVPTPSPGIFGSFESVIKTAETRVFGFVGGLSVRYELNSNWFLCASINQSILTYHYDRKFEVVYQDKRFPSRFDLNFKLGIGRKFGK